MSRYDYVRENKRSRSKYSQVGDVFSNTYKAGRKLEQSWKNKNKQELKTLLWQFVSLEKIWKGSVCFIWKLTYSVGNCVIFDKFLFSGIDSSEKKRHFEEDVDYILWLYKKGG